jgi:hypothetical protein
MRNGVWIAGWVALGVLAACGERGDLPPPEGGLGRIAAGLAVPAELAEEVPAVKFEVVAEDGSTQANVVAVEASPPEFGGSALEGQRGASWYLSLNPGRYLLRAIPLNASSKPSTVCGMATSFATVSAGKTTEIRLVSNCTTGGSGGLDVSVRLNQGPFISELSFIDGTRICASEAAELTLSATDRDDDALETSWRVTSTPEGAGGGDFCFATSNTQAAFAASAPGRYGFEVQVSDRADTASLEFHIDIVDCGDIPACPGAVFDFPGATAVAGRCDCDAAFCGDGVVEGSEKCEPPGVGNCNTDCSLIGDVRTAFASQPPKIESATITSADASFDGKTALLRVEVAKQDIARVGSALSFFGEGDKVFTLFDEDAANGNLAKDGVYTGKVSVSAASLDKAAARSELAALRAPSESAFDGREVSGSEAIAKFPSTTDLATGETFDIAFRGFSSTDPGKTLMVTDVSVVEDPARTFDLCNGQGDPDGAWTFKTLMTAMANTPATGIAPEDFVRNWLQQFSASNPISNGEFTEPRPMMDDFIAEWEQISGVPPGGPLDLNLAPFRLLAIVNRLDLTTNLGYGGNAGEGRFVFAVLDPTNPCAFKRFTVILEYGIPLSKCVSIQNYACQWQALDSLPFPSAAYNDALQALTDVFALAGANPAQLPNQSAINQVRTNDNALAQVGWEFREFKPEGPGGANPGMLAHVGLALQPRHETPEHFAHPDTVNLSLDFSSFVMSHLQAVLSETHTVPEFWPAGTPFQAATVTYQPDNFFEAPPPATQTLPDFEARQKFSLNTCSGCHGGETLTIFTHVSMRPPGDPATLSGFLTGITVTDPADPSTTRTFDDLARRNQRLDALCTQSCSLQFLSGPTAKVH